MKFFFKLKQKKNLYKRYDIINLRGWGTKNPPNQTFLKLKNRFFKTIMFIRGGRKEGKTGANRFEDEGKREQYKRSACDRER